MEHSVNREQGLLFYLPINNEVKLNLLKSSLWFSFYRPSNLISGISLKSRIRIVTKGRPLRTDNEPFTDIVVYEGDPNLVVSFNVFLFFNILSHYISSFIVPLKHKIGKQTYQERSRRFRFDDNRCIASIRYHESHEADVSHGAFDQYIASE